jgi:dihydroflavonol-4-reductase
MGASGFVGSHVVRQLVARGDDVRVMLRTTSSTKAIDDLDVELHYGDLFDDDALRTAMAGCDDVFYCVLDARAFLRDSAPLFRTNVDGLRHVLDVAVEADLHRFVFTSTIGTIAVSNNGASTEDDPFNMLDCGGPYIQSRFAAEQLVLDYAVDRGLPAVAMCISNTFGPGDWGPTPHGSLLAAAAAGKVPVYVRNTSCEAVGIEDAARAMLLAADKGRVGERYIVSERYISWRELCDTAAAAGGARPPRIGIPRKLLYALAFGGDLVGKVVRTVPRLTLGVRLMELTSPMDHTKATTELGWHPEPIHDAVEKAVAFYLDRARQPRPQCARIPLRGR